MARFHYAYQKIVDLKTSEKSQAEWQLSIVVGKLSQEESSLQKLQEERALWCEKLQQASQQAVPLSAILTMQSYIDFLDDGILRKLRDVKKAESAVEAGRRFLSDRMMDEKVWLKTKENALRRFQADRMTKEQNELDELATVRFMYAAP
ncbi:flagellar export protein FliJ [Paenibacillus sacheonensis]|uniref:Flagellar FliJ protein n=1 Tax=Paenibacillus sacheonensis TaxID=742054 RepID=A0A7X5BW79_9BACL|nr:flagellar export protein FliJ [Paenibacillus sacheonensis]MBM7564611.1 flagellar FliJ protein [Paenibacillus sacheonensis]NBC69168.1 flagellar export protein FliJ [Paenibacillus sacheonensis]